MTGNMKRVNDILENAEYCELLRKIEYLEKDRIFCKHTMEHFLDTARIMYITSLEQGLNIKKDIIYTTALLHDIGRVMQYEGGVSHDKASAEFAERILPNYEFSDVEINQIVQAILSHRECNDDNNLLGRLLYNADKISRLCFCCKSEQECYWSKSKKNFYITY